MNIKIQRDFAGVIKLKILRWGDYSNWVIKLFKSVLLKDSQRFDRWKWTGFMTIEAEIEVI